MLILHGHPLSSFCMKVAMALDELGLSFRSEMVDLGDEAARARFLALWPLGKMPVLSDDAAEEAVPETSIIVDYLAARYPGSKTLIPADPDRAWRARFWDRFFDLHVMAPVQRYADFRLGRPGSRDEAIPDVVRGQLASAFGVLEAQVGEPWMLGSDLTVAECAGAPALFYADRIVPLAEAHPAAAAYLERLKQRPSFARALAQAAPYMHMVPY